MNKRMINVDDYAGDIYKAVKKGVYITTKAEGRVNSMVIEWGHIGQIWSLPVFISYVRDCRFTRELLDKNPEFTVNIPMGKHDKKAFTICGTKSGRDMDKIKEAGLTPVESEVITAPGIKEFPLTLECRVIYREEQDAASLPDSIKDKFYTVEKGDHIAYYGEIVAAYIIE